MQLWEQFGIKPLLQSWGRKNKSLCIGQRYLPYPHVFHKIYTTDFPHTSCRSHSTSEKGKVKLETVSLWKCWWRICVSVPRMDLSVHKDVVTIQLSVLLLSSVPPQGQSLLLLLRATEQKNYHLYPSYTFHLIYHLNFCLKEKMA